MYVCMYVCMSAIWPSASSGYVSVLISFCCCCCFYYFILSNTSTLDHHYALLRIYMYSFANHTYSKSYLHVLFSIIIKAV